jgi:hypothetical protein
MVSFPAWAPWIIVVAIGLSPIFGLYVFLVIGRYFPRRTSRRVVLPMLAQSRGILPREKGAVHPIDEISE